MTAARISIRLKMSHEGVVTLSLIDWNLPTATDFDAWDFKGLACRSIVHIGPISLNVTMPTNVFALPIAPD